MLFDLKSIKKGSDDFIYINISSDYVLRMNILNESVEYDSSVMDIDEINIDLINYADNSVQKVSNIIGLEVGNVQIVTEHPELIGKKLTFDNKDDCYIFTLFD